MGPKNKVGKKKGKPGRKPKSDTKQTLGDAVLSHDLLANLPISEIALPKTKRAASADSPSTGRPKKRKLKDATASSSGKLKKKKGKDTEVFSSAKLKKAKSNSSKTSQVKNAFIVEVVITEFTLPDRAEKCFLDIKVFPQTRVQVVHEGIAKALRLPNALDEYEYVYNSSERRPIDIQKSFLENFIFNGDSILLQRKKPELRKKRNASSLNEVTYDFPVLPEYAQEDLIELVITTRIKDVNGNPFKRTRVRLHPDQDCGDLMEDITTLWDKKNLKFKYGRSVLTAEKVISAIDIQDKGEIVVTGGRD